MSESISMSEEERNAVKEFLDAAVIRANDKIKKIAKEDGYISFADAIKIMYDELGLDTSHTNFNFIDPPGWRCEIEQNLNFIEKETSNENN